MPSAAPSRPAEPTMWADDVALVPRGPQFLLLSEKLRTSLPAHRSLKTMMPAGAGGDDEERNWQFNGARGKHLGIMDLRTGRSGQRTRSARHNLRRRCTHHADLPT
jgi:hypothetical protein